jgi:hypothetical protein
VEQELLTRPFCVFIIGFSGFRVPQSIVCYVVFCRSLVGSFGHFSVCPSSISGFWLLIWYLQTFPKIMQCAWIKMGSTTNNGRKNYIQFKCLLSQDISMATERTIYFVFYFIHHFFSLCLVFEIFKISFVYWSTSLTPVLSVY